jgi:hypothetical protein
MTMSSMSSDMTSTSMPLARYASRRGDALRVFSSPPVM